MNYLFDFPGKYQRWGMNQEAVKQFVRLDGWPNSGKDMGR